MFSRRARNSDCISFLKEIGIYSPQEDASLMCDLDRGRLSKKGDQDDEMATEAMKAVIAKGLYNYEKSTGNDERDPLEKIRHEISRPVFVIDDPTAHELDDGISIERCGDANWIHVHIADPTAYLPKSDPISLLALQRGTSIYLPQTHFPMMPSGLSDNLLNLGVARSAMTFSAKLDKGEIVDYRVSASLLNDVRKVSYDQVNTVLNWDAVIKSGNGSKYESELFESRHVKPIAEIKNKEDLLLLQKVGQEHFAKRLLAGAFNPHTYEIKIRVKSNLGSKYQLTPYNHTNSFAEPISSQTGHISIEPYISNGLSPSALLVQECMIIANRIASKYCTDNNLPTVYRGQQKMSEFAEMIGMNSVPELKALEQLIQDKKDKFTGTIEGEIMQKMLNGASNAIVSDKSQSHYMMGIPNTGPFNGYVRVTSPLRRYQDMACHYQIQASLLGEKAPFDAFANLEMMTHLQRATLQAVFIQKKSKRYWLLEFLRRKAFAPTATFEAAQIIGRDSHRRYATNAIKTTAISYPAVVVGFPGKDRKVQIPQLGGLLAQCDFSKNNLVGDIIEVVVKEVDPDVGFCSFFQL